ncbi:MAG: L-lactate permease [Rhodospirillales bacterium]|nr:MAG: L-lactate permease [Rhodospirillales bacterium]
MDLIVSIAPIILLIFLMTKKSSMPSHVAMPLVAALVYAIKLVYFGENANLVNATVVNGLLTALTPILIVWGAIFMFKTMEHSGAMAMVSQWLNGVSANPVAQLMIIGWAFSFMIEGASGFGTPAALAAPILVGLGFPALKVAVLALIMNSVPVSFGAVGTPLWFGLGQLNLSDAELLAIGFQTALVHAAAALVIPIIALLSVVGWREVRRNLLFVYLSILACTVPYVLLALYNYEFPALLAGMIGFAVSIVLARNGVGLSRAGTATPTPSGARISTGQLVKALFPLWATVLLLLVTRIEPIGLQAFLTDATPALQVSLGTFAEFSTSWSLVLVLDRIFEADSRWVLQALYVPAIIPFFVVSAMTFALFRVRGSVIIRVAAESYGRMVNTIIALLAALVLVSLLMVGEESMVIRIGQGFASVTGPHWQYVAALLGALGTFFSGSATISNLTFGAIQDSIATDLGLDRILVLSLQSVGAAMGNMVSINNVVAVCSILGIANKEGAILKKTFPPMIVYAVFAGAAGLLL